MCVPPCDAGGVLLGRQFACRDALAQLLVDVGNRLCGGAAAGIVKQYPMARLGRHLGDARTHGPGTDYRNSGLWGQCALADVPGNFLYVPSLAG